jgi:hypothetical protein
MDLGAEVSSQHAFLAPSGRYLTKSRTNVSLIKRAKMPSYQNAVPPFSLFPGDVGFSFNNEAFPGSAQAGSSARTDGHEPSKGRVDYRKLSDEQILEL